MSLATLRNRINAFLADRWPALVARQDAYYATHGRYWQGKWTHNAAVDNSDESSDAVPDALDDSPTDQRVSWRDRFGGALDAIPFPARLKIDVYESPRGHGWVATVQVLHRRTIYERSQGVGPDAATYTRDWHTVEVEQ